MSRWLGRVDLRTVVAVVLLDALTYVLVYWLVLPAVQPIADTFEQTVALGVAHTVVAVRLTMVGLFAARAMRRRVGIGSRTDALPSIVLGSVITLTLGLLLGILGRAFTGTANPSVILYLISVAEGLVFPVLGLMFVMPGKAESPLFLRPRV